ncbi:L-lactate permease [Bacillus sp. REN16]|uniref:L-lactate permease n=1 Tax=Bacillus sp. REN16 TaxID=2887296 RepID=UPI001E493812|nr:L-lactate permease [Bacillus sp. REN16]MCC3356797.1 L-lactate permease [Bacillus sp. REN16]
MWNVILSLLPIVVIIILLFVFKMSSAKAGFLSLIVTMLIALFYNTSTHGPTEIAFASFHGVLIAMVVIYVLLFGIFLFHLMDQSGLISTLSSFVQNTTKDPARQVIILGVAFSPLIESVSGFGIGVVVITPILIALGFNRYQAALVSLISLSAVPWGALATGIVIGSRLTDVSVQTIGVWSAYLCIPTFIYFAMISIYILKGIRGIIEKWLELLLVSGALAVGVWFSNQWVSVELSGVLGSLIALCIEGLFLFYFHHRSKSGVKTKKEKVSSLLEWISQYASIIKVLMPYLFLTCLLIISRVVPAVESALTSFAVLKWEEYSFSLPILYSPGFFLLITCIFTILLFKLKKKVILSAMKSTIKQLNPIAVTTISFIVLAEVMSKVGMTTTLAVAAGDSLGSGFFWISPLIGGFSGLITGSNAASNAMLIKLQIQAANQFNFSTELIAGIQNTSASHMTMASPSRVLLAATVSGEVKRESELFRTIFLIAAGSLLLMMITAVFLRGT